MTSAVAFCLLNNYLIVETLQLVSDHWANWINLSDRLDNDGGGGCHIRHGLMNRWSIGNNYTSSLSLGVEGGGALFLCRNSTQSNKSWVLKKNYFIHLGVKFAEMLTPNVTKAVTKML